MPSGAYSWPFVFPGLVFRTVETCKGLAGNLWGLVSLVGAAWRKSVEPRPHI